MNLNKKILKVINEGSLNAISFDDDIPDTTEVSMHRISNNDTLGILDKKLEKEYYQHKLADFYDNFTVESLDPTKDFSELVQEYMNTFYNMGVEYHEKYGVTYNPHLDGKRFKAFIELIIGILGTEKPKANLNWIDTSEVTDMEYLFAGTLREWNCFNGDISEWDVSNVTNMQEMFWTCKFNGDLSKWDISNVKDMNGMFEYSLFNNDSICNWDVSHVMDVGNMFYNNMIFDLDLSKWQISHGLPKWLFNFDEEDHTKMTMDKLPQTQRFL